jgi:nitrogenase-stabilizing/protective protein
MNTAAAEPGFTPSFDPTPTMETTTMDTFLQQLKALSSAEDFLQFFGVPFDQHVVNVSRLHILKRFFQYLRQQNLQTPDDELRMFTAYRQQLARAYADFVSSTPAQEKVFKVFQDTNGRQHVSLDSLKASLPQRAAA